MNFFQKFISGNTPIGQNNETSQTAEVNSQILQDAKMPPPQPPVPNPVNDFSNENDLCEGFVPDETPFDEAKNTLAGFAPSIPFGFTSFKSKDVKIGLYKGRDNVMGMELIHQQNVDPKRIRDAINNIKDSIRRAPNYHPGRPIGGFGITTPSFSDDTVEDNSNDKDIVLPEESNDNVKNPNEDTTVDETVTPEVEEQDEEKELEETTVYKTGFGVNGAIDEGIIQGDTGDCWIIAGLASLSSAESGKDVIKNSITVNDDSVTVNFKGVGASYEIPSEEIKSHDTDKNLTDAYSNGDNDALVIELAVEKLWEDIESGKVEIKSNDSELQYANTDGGIGSGGLPKQLIYYFTGTECKEYYYNDLSNLSKNDVKTILESALANDNAVVNFALYGNNTHRAYLTNGELYQINTGGVGHSYSITNVTKDTVTFVNPWDTNESYEMKWSDFAKLGIGYMTVADVA